MSCHECDVGFIYFLPPEMVVKIFMCLLLDDVLRCSLVNKRWHSTVYDLEEYFLCACATFGLSSKTVSKERWRYSSYRELIMVARKQRLFLNVFPPSVIRLTSNKLAANEHYEFNSSNGNLIIRTLYRDFKPVHTSVERVSADSLSQLHVFPPRTEALSQNRVKWAAMDSSNKLLLYATASGIWTGHHLSATNAPSSQWRTDPMYDSGVTVGCCAKCCLVLVGQVASWSRAHSPTSAPELLLKAITFGRNLTTQTPNSTQWRVAFKTQVSGLAIIYGKTKIRVLPNSECLDNNGEHCMSHVIIHQLDNTVTSYILTLEPPTLSLRNPFQVPPKIEDRQKTLDLAVSPDNSLVAFLSGHHLYVSDVQSCATQSAVTLDIRGLQYKNMRLLALGHVYTLIGLEPYDTLLVVATHTGTVVSKYCKFATYSGSGSHHIEYLCVTDTLWLDDISCLCSRDTPTILYWNYSTRCVEGLCLGQQRQNPPISCPQPVKKKGWGWKR